MKLEIECLEIHKDGTKYWRNSRGQVHCINAPAIIKTNGSEYWCICGKIHREDGPAVIKINKDSDKNTEHWFLNNIEYETPEEMPLSLFFAYCKYNL